MCFCYCSVGTQETESLPTLLKFWMLHGASCIICWLCFTHTATWICKSALATATFQFRYVFILFFFPQIFPCILVYQILFGFIKSLDECVVKSTIILTLSCVNFLGIGIQKLFNLISYMGNCFLLFKHIYKLPSFNLWF